MKNLFKITVIVLLFSSCSSTQLVTISVLQPAPVTLPAYVKNVVVVNRTTPSQKVKIINVVNKALSGEGTGLDKEGSKAATTGLADELSKNVHIDSVSIIDNSNLTTDVPGSFPTPLAWDEVEKYCREHNADALFALEIFDTKSDIDYTANQTAIKTPLGNVPALEQTANMHTSVTTGWRIYDVKNKNILDEIAFSRMLVFHGQGINPLLAANALIGRKEAVKQVGNLAGHDYAFSIVPVWKRVSRDYYVKGSNNFTMATRKARTGNWDDAASLWNEETDNPNGKIAGRACYNMAIICEINGDLDGAIKWAQKSYENYNNHLALNYVKILNDRKLDNQKLNDQQVTMTK
ncbi:MAG TPA: DUF6340 family protein [Hanamia sp.]